MKKKILNEKGQTSKKNSIIKEVDVRKRKRIVVEEEVPEQPVETLVSPKSDVHQSPSSNHISKKYVRNTKDEKLVKKVEFQPKKP